MSLRWIGFSWPRLGGAALVIGTTAVYVGFGVIALLGFWYFAQSVQR